MIARDRHRDADRTACAYCNVAAVSRRSTFSPTTLTSSARRAVPTARHILQTAERALTAYFAGASDAFRDVVVAPEGTDFQLAVWSAPRTIPEGTTISYRELAQRIGKPDAVRAVGLANGRNPIPIVVPCHRVIGTDRSLTGFGLGVPVKAWLLVHEHAAEPFPTGVTAATRVVAPASLW